MSRIIALGLLVVVLAACGPVAEPATPEDPATPAATAPVVVSAAEAAWQAEVDRYLAVNVQPSDPVDAMIWRGVRCEFLDSEIGGDNSAQDQAIRSRMDELRCGGELAGEARELRETLAGDPTAVARLDGLLARG